MRAYARAARTGLVIAAMMVAAVVAPVSVPAAVVLRWLRRDDRRIEHVIAAPNVRLLPSREP
jgi:hypothetical protein